MQHGVPRGPFGAVLAMMAADREREEDTFGSTGELAAPPEESPPPPPPRLVIPPPPWITQANEPLPPEPPRPDYPAKRASREEDAA